MSRYMNCKLLLLSYTGHNAEFVCNNCNDSYVNLNCGENYIPIPNKISDNETERYAIAKEKYEERYHRYDALNLR